VLQTAFELVVEVILRMARESSGAPSSTGPDEARPEDRSAGRRARDRHACFEWSETPGARRRARGWLIAVERWTAYQAVLLTLFRGTFLAGTALTAVCVSVFRSAAVVFLGRLLDGRCPGDLGRVRRRPKRSHEVNDWGSGGALVFAMLLTKASAIPSSCGRTATSLVRNANARSRISSGHSIVAIASTLSFTLRS
jgi:hypothetical protein